jgi:acetylornithine deacetylase/succinyl-diaminopimelate desuccinylase-like protein
MCDVDRMTGTGVSDVALDLAVELVRTDSVNPDLVPGAAGEGAVVDRLARRLGAHGFAVEIVPAPSRAGRPSLIATHRGSGGGRSLVLNGHLDTVGVTGMADPFAGRIVGDRLLGRGSCDMKGGLAAMIAAAEAAAVRGTAGDVVLALVADEEHASVGMEAVLERLAGRLPHACLVGEPTWLDLAAAHRGYCVLEVSFTGRAAHSSQPGDGVNAVVHLGRLLAAVEARDAVLAVNGSHPLVGAGSLMSTVVRGGTSPFVLAEAASAVIERRTLPGEPAGVGLEEVEQILEAMRRDDPSVEASVSLVLAREPWEHDDGSPAGADLAAALTEALAERTGHRPERMGAPYWMESALWQGAGVPTVICGPAGGGLHAADEWVDVGQVGDYAEALVAVIRRFCGPAA